ncbi:MAG: LPS export ABC transporter permease LptF [Sideroxydans sp.]
MPDYPQSPQVKQCKVRGLFHWSLVREFAATGALIFAILLGIIVFTQLIRLLGDSVAGRLPVDGILVLLGFSALNYLPVLLSVSLFLSVLLTLSRCYRDSEMVVWFSSGIGLTRWIRPVLSYALPVVLLIALLSMVISPWALSGADEFKRRLDSRDDVSRASPGMFRESQQADRVFFLEDVDAEHKRVGNIFVQAVQDGREGTMVAREGYQETAANGDRFLVLLNGRRYEGVPGQADFRIAEFERYAMRIEPAELRQEQPSVKAYPTLQLLRDPTPWNMSEFAWRVGLPVSALLLALMAIPLSFVDPRAGRSFNLIAAIVIYMIYNNLISVTNAWIAREKVGILLGLWGVHLMMAGVLLVYFYHRASPFAWKRRP